MYYLLCALLFGQILMNFFGQKLKGLESIEALLEKVVINFQWIICPQKKDVLKQSIGIWKQY